MITSPTTPAPIRVAVPSPRVLRLINPFVSAILRSSFHRVLSQNLLLLSFTGRRSGKRIRIPVGYTRVGDELTVFSTRTWWKGLSGETVSLILEGQRRTARAEPTADRETVVAEVLRYVSRYGARAAGTRIGVALDPAHPPTHDELLRGLPPLAVIHLTLDPVTGPKIA